MSITIGATTDNANGDRTYHEKGCQVERDEPCSCVPLVRTVAERLDLIERSLVSLRQAQNLGPLAPFLGLIDDEGTS